MTYKFRCPSLVFSSQNDEVKLLEAKLQTSKIVSNFMSIPGSVLRASGVPSVFVSGLNALLDFVNDVEAVKVALLDAKIKRSEVNNATSRFKAEVKTIEGRILRMTANSPRNERKHEVVYAIATCETILTLFQDENCVFWKHPEISSPLLVSFAGLYVAVGKMVVELRESYKENIASEMKRLGDTVDNYRKRFLCFRIYLTKFKLMISEKIVDQYDKAYSLKKKKVLEEEFSCRCLAKQRYTALLGHTYGSFFDSAKVAIIESGLLSPGVTINNDWCISHNRCYTLYRPQNSCYCNTWDRDEDYVMIKDEQVEQTIAAGKCISDECTFEHRARHYYYSCKNCRRSVGDRICRSCVRKCHKDHAVEFSNYGWFFCDCSNNLLKKDCELIGSKYDQSLLGIVKQKLGINKESRMKPNAHNWVINKRKYGYFEEKDGCLTEASESKENNDTTGTHVFCNECHKFLLDEPRYKCVECNDFDLCHRCLINGIHTSHRFVRIMKSADRISKPEVVHQNVSCDGCNAAPLCGKRYKCTRCEDYDLCEDCRNVGIHNRHEFEEIKVRRNQTCNVGWDWLFAPN